MIGWYHSGPKLLSSDIEINELFKKYNPNPVLVVIDVKPNDLGLPTDAYYSVDEIHDDGTATTKTFNHIPSSIEAEEAEEIGVEHLLRDIKDTAVGSLSTKIVSQLDSLKALHQHLGDIHNYLEKVLSGALPVNHSIIYNLQDMFNLLPDIHLTDTVKSFAVKTNDELLVIYLSSMIRSVIALHNLIENKGMLRDEEKTPEEAEEAVPKVEAPVVVAK
jgi:26S proteasome regulatory subunit N8